MKFKKGDRVYWPKAPQTKDDTPCAIVYGVVGVISWLNKKEELYSVTFNDNDIRSTFTDDELVSEVEWNSPLYQALL